MAISALANIQENFLGDGTTTTVNIDLSRLTIVNGFNLPCSILRPNNLPTGVHGITVDSSSSGFTSSVSGSTLTLTFTTAPNSNLHTVNGQIAFSQF